MFTCCFDNNECVRNKWSESEWKGPTGQRSAVSSACPSFFLGLKKQQHTTHSRTFISFWILDFFSKNRIAKFFYRTTNFSLITWLPSRDFESYFFFKKKKKMSKNLLERKKRNRHSRPSGSFSRCFTTTTWRRSDSLGRWTFSLNSFLSFFF